MDDDKNPICHLTEQCISMFKTFSEHSDFTDDDWLEDRAADFAWWSYSLKAHKTGRSSLDYRLRSRPDVQKIITNLLESLATTLNDYLKSGRDLLVDTGTASASYHAEVTNDGSNTSPGAGSNSSWSEFSDEDESTKSERPAESPTEADQVGSRFYIKTYIELLTKMSNAIIKSGARLRYLKADEYLQHHQDDEDYEQLRKHLLFVTVVGLYEQRLFEELHRQTFNGLISRAVEVVIRSYITDSSRLTDLQRRFIQLNVVRRNRICYELGRSGKRLIRPETTRTKPVPDPTTFQSNPPVEDDEGLLMTDKARKLSTLSQAPSERTEYPKSMTATELGSQFVAPIRTPFDPLDARKPSSTITRITQTGHQQDYPPCPASKGSFQCPYCGQLLSEEYLAKSRWRGHVAQDLGPYSCIYDKCPNPDEFFATKDQWLQHITSQHTIERWLCDDCTFRGESEDDIIFETEEEWERHIDICHKEQCAQLALLTSISKRQVPELMKCPLCVRPTAYLRPDHDDHIAQHLHSWALRALPWTLNAENQDSDSNAIAGSNNDLARMSDLSSLPDRMKNNFEDTSVLSPGMYVHELPHYLQDFSFEESSMEYKRALEAVDVLPAPPALPSFLSKPILYERVNYPGVTDALNMPNHTMLNHLLTTSVKHDVLSIATTTRYREKYITTILHRPAEGTYAKEVSAEKAAAGIEESSPEELPSLLPQEQTPNLDPFGRRKEKVDISNLDPPNNDT